MLATAIILAAPAWTKNSYSKVYDVPHSCLEWNSRDCHDWNDVPIKETQYQEMFAVSNSLFVV